MGAGELAKRQVKLKTHRIYALPLVVMMPHSACNCRCVMCDIWMANRNKRELSRNDLAPHLPSMRLLGAKHVGLSGGETLMHSNLGTLRDLLRQARVARITLLPTGLLLEPRARAVAPPCHDVTR